jgi:hypothetical protein
MFPRYYRIGARRYGIARLACKPLSHVALIA